MVNLMDVSSSFGGTFPLFDHFPLILGFFPSFFWAFSPILGYPDPIIPPFHLFCRAFQLLWGLLAVRAFEGFSPFCALFPPLFWPFCPFLTVLRLSHPFWGLSLLYFWDFMPTLGFFPPFCFVVFFISRNCAPKSPSLSLTPPHPIERWEREAGPGGVQRPVEQDPQLPGGGRGLGGDGGFWKGVVGWGLGREVMEVGGCCGVLVGEGYGVWGGVMGDGEGLRGGLWDFGGVKGGDGVGVGVWVSSGVPLMPPSPILGSH